MSKLTENKITTIILAGGESSRMGRDKALLTIKNRPLLAHICLIAKEVSQTVYIVTPWTKKYQFLLPLGCQLIREELVLNQTSNTPIIGFLQAFPLVKTEWILLLACDLPYLSSSQVKQWSKALTTVLPTEIALLPSNEKGWEALCGFYRQNCQSSIESYVMRGGKSFQGWLAKHSVKELIIEDRTCLFNCNTPQDWQSINK